MLRPEPPITDPASASEVDLFDWFATVPDVLRLGHIDDPPRRHYSAFIRLQAMRQQDQDDQLIEAVLRNLRSRIRGTSALRGSSIQLSASPMAIWYVASDGNAEKLAERGSRLSDRPGVPR